MHYCATIFTNVSYKRKVFIRIIIIHNIFSIQFSTKRLYFFFIYLFLSTEIRNRHLQLDAIKHLVQLLPIANRNTLHALLIFLSSMAKCSEDTKDSYGKCYTAIVSHI